MLAIFANAGYKLLHKELKSYLAKEDAKDFIVIPDYLFIIFLDGLIIEKRGKRDGEVELKQTERVASAKKQKLTNNLILNKIKIALTLTTDDLIALLKLADFRVSKSEMSAFFRKPEHRNFRECGNQLLRNLLTGITLKYQSKPKQKKKHHQ